LTSCMASHIATTRDTMVIYDLCGTPHGTPRARASWVRHIVLLLCLGEALAGLIAFLESGVRCLAAAGGSGARLAFFRLKG
jgi:hypothetical protein